MTHDETVTMRAPLVCASSSTPSPASQPIVEQLPVGIFRKDAAGRFIFVNARFCQLMGITADQLLGRTAAEIAAEGHGQSPHLQIVEAAVPGHEQTIEGTQGVLLDLAPRTEGDGILANERDLLRALLDNSPDHIYFKDRQSRFIVSSTAQALQFGMSTPDGLVGKSDFDVFSEEHARPAFEDEQEIIRTGLPMIGKVEKETWMDGRPDTWGLTTKMPLRNRDGEIIGTFGITKDISELKQAEHRIAEVHTQLLEASRLAGMAEIATNVLHNVGNVLNSVNVAADMVSSRLRNSKLKGLSRAVQLMDAHADDLGEFFARDTRGKLLPGYLRELALALEAEHAAMAENLGVLGKSIDHIKEVVATQQSYAGASHVVEMLRFDELLDDALRMNAGGLTQRNVEVVKNIAELPPLPLDRHRLLQILVNLISNAKQAMNDAQDQKSPRISLGAALVDVADGRVLRVTVADNGEGIAPEHLIRVFAHGFTTRKNGHGFGLHSCVLAAQEMRGTLTAHSDGPGRGATFSLEIPIDTSKVRR